MGKKRGGSKNALENRGKTEVKICGECKKEIKAVQVRTNGNTGKMYVQCNCGVINKAGEIMNF